MRKDKGDNNDKVGMAMDVRLDGRESKQHRIALKPHRRTRKAMEALASHLKRFLLEKENVRWMSFVGEEKARDLRGTIVAFRDAHARCSEGRCREKKPTV